MFLMAVDEASGTPIYRQIVERVQTMADDGSLEPGSRLPPSRELACRLGVNRSTVLRAYSELWALGYLESRPGSYSTLRRRPPLARGPRPGNGGRFDWSAAPTPAARAVHATQLRSVSLASRSTTRGFVNFATLAGDRNLAPLDELRRIVARVLREQPATVTDYGSPAGDAALRQAVAVRMRSHGVAVGAEQVMITNGAQHGIELVAKLLLGPGRAVAVERPTYSAALPLLAFSGARILEAPMRPDGVDLDALDALLATERPAFFYSMPSFHNPTGVATSQAHRERLLEICRRHAVPLVEDGFEEELKYSGRAVLPVKSMDETGCVIYLGTLSKVVFPGLRVGWVAADAACIERMVSLNRFASLSTTALAQAAVARFVSDGHLETHLRRLHRAYRARMAALLAALERHMPDGVEWTRPEGGYTAWVSLPGATVAEDSLLEALGAAGVAVAPGSLFFATPPEAPGFRISISNLTESEIDDGVARMARALAPLVRR